MFGFIHIFTTQITFQWSDVLGLMIEPEKEIVLILAESIIANNVVDSITEAVNLDEPGAGIGFIVPLQKLFGITHMRCDNESSSQENSEP